jgi:single-strand DNA-binding protein
MDYNNVMLLGRIGREPESRTSAQGLTICNFSVATNHRVKEVDKTEWSNVVAFGKLGDAVISYGSKGARVFVEGRLETSSWDDKNGEKRYKTQIIAKQVILLSPKEESQSFEVKETYPNVELEASKFEDIPF